MLAVQALQEHAVVLVARHRRARIPQPAIRLPAIAVGPVLAGGDADDQHFAVVAERHALDARERGRVDLAELLRHLFEGVVADLLADDGPVGFDAEEYAASAVVQHGAQSPRCLATLAGGALELQRLGFAVGGPSGDLVVGHGMASTISPSLRTDHPRLLSQARAACSTSDSTISVILPFRSLLLLTKGIGCVASAPSCVYTTV